MPIASEVLKSKKLGIATLFNFINYAGPKTTLPQANSSYSFIDNTAVAASHFLSAVDSATTFEERDTALAAALDTFSPVTSLKAIFEINRDIYNYGLFASRYTAQTTAEELAQKAAGVEPLTAAQKNTLWDNLYYQAVKNGSTLMADAIVVMLRGNEFLNEYNTQIDELPEEPDDETIENNKEILSRLASASAIISSKLVDSPVTPSPAPKNDLDVQTKDALFRKNNAAIARYHIGKLEQVNEELKLAELKYIQENSEQYKIAYNEYVAAVRQMIPPVVGKEAEPLPELDFTPQNPFGEDFLNENLSVEAKEFLLYVKHRTHNNFRDIIDSVDNLQQAAYGRLSQNADRPDKKIILADFEIPVALKPRNNSFVISSEKKLGNENVVQVFVTHYFDNPETALTSIDIQAVGEGDVTYNSKATSPIVKTDTHITFLLFEQGIPLIEGGYTISGSYHTETQSFSSDFSFPDFDFSKPYYGALKFEQPPMALLLMNTDNDLEPGTNRIPLYGVKRVGVLEYKRVEQRICCYVAGEVSHIENVMAREYREKTSRTLTRSETIQEDTQEREVENLKDTTSTDRHEMNSEVSQVLQEEQSRQIGVNAGGNFQYNGGMFNAGVFANTNMNFTNSSSQNTAVKTAQAFAKEVVEKATQRIVEKVSSKRTSRMLREYEETNKHGFDNTLGDKHVTGIYRWVDKIYENTLVNYGKRLLYDFMVPEPSKNFKHWMQKSKSSKTFTLTEPKKLSSFGIEITSFKNLKGQEIGKSEWLSINKFNYADAAAEYGADVDPCPDEYISIGKSFSENPANPVQKWDERLGSYAYEIEIPEGYACVDYWGNYGHTYSYDTGKWGSEAVLKVDTDWFWFNKPAHWKLNFNNYFTRWSNHHIWLYKKLPISISTFNVGGFSFNITAGCRLTQEAYQVWQQKTYIAILTAYKKRLEEFNNAKAVVDAANENVQTDYKFNPMTGRAIEQRELKRLCIELMLEPFNKKSGRYNYVDDPCLTELNYKIRRDSGFEEHAEYTRFIEEAFQWDLMSYHLYPYYWAGEADWHQLIKESSTSDELFQAFLQSGMARVTVPVRMDYEFAVTYLLNTGKVWNSKNVIATGANNPLYLSIADLLKYDEGKPEATWHTRIPTALTIIQTDSSPLNDQGLPCEWTMKNGKKVYCENGEPIAADPTNLLNDGSSSSASGGGSFIFPRRPDLNIADIGKIVVNAGDGAASVPVPSPALPPQTGRFRVRIEDINYLEDFSTINIENNITGAYYSATRIDWRNGETPVTVEEELTLLKTYLEGMPGFTFLDLSIENDDLILEENEAQLTRIKLDRFPKRALYIIKPATPSIAAAFTGYPLGKLLGIDGNNAIISNGLIETYSLESPFTVNQNLFTSDGELNFETEEDFESLLNHIIIPAAGGKVKPIGLSSSEFNDHFINTYRNHFVGVAIASTGTEVTVAKLSYLSLIFHVARRAASKGFLSFGD